MYTINGCAIAHGTGGVGNEAVRGRVANNGVWRSIGHGRFGDLVTAGRSIL